jgi:hypothetical protein
VYEKIFEERTTELTAISADPKSSASANFSIWQSLSDVDGNISSDLGSVENECDNLTTDPLATSNISSYESDVKTLQIEIAKYMDQRKALLTSLGY